MSSEAPKWTPGPWRIGNAGSIVSDCPTGCTEHQKPESHESFYGGHFVCESTGGADAHLIAAAPELYDALEAAPVPVDGEPTVEFFDRHKHWVDKIQSPAMRKATHAD